MGWDPYRLNPPPMPAFRSVFISYHHDEDQAFYDALADLLEGSPYKILRDDSLDREIDSDDPQYVMRRIREDYISGTSCTVVLCGAQTPWRKYVDWEISATLDKGHGLVGVNLPTNPRNGAGNFTVASRLHDNIQSGYALWKLWTALANAAVPVAELRVWIEEAQARPARLIDNRRPLRQRNG